MNVSPQEFEACIVALGRTVADHEIMGRQSRHKGDGNGEFLATSLAIEAKVLMTKLQETKRLQLNIPERDILLAALRHTAKVHMDLAARERDGFERQKRERFAGSFALLSDRIAAATASKPH